MTVLVDGSGRQPNPSACGARGQYHPPEPTKQNSPVSVSMNTYTVVTSKKYCNC